MKPVSALSLGLAGVLLCAPTFAQTVQVQLRPHEEVPSVSSTASGFFQAHIDEAAGQIAYQLVYSGLQGDVRQAHIHFGQRGVNGGVSVFLCQTSFNADPTGLAPTCPAEGRVSGLLGADNVIGPGAQGMAPGEFAELLSALRAGVAYVNVHSTTFPGGELRGQLRAGRNMSGR